MSEQASARLRPNAGAQDMDKDTTLDKTPSALEEGQVISKPGLNEKANGTRDELEDKPNEEDLSLDTERPKFSSRFHEFLHRIQGKHVDHIPTFKESLIATVRQSC